MGRTHVIHRRSVNVVCVISTFSVLIEDARPQIICESCLCCFYFLMKLRENPLAYCTWCKIRYIMYHMVPYILACRVGDRCRIHRIESTLAQKLSRQFLNSVVSKAVVRVRISMYDLFLGVHSYYIFS